MTRFTFNRLGRTLLMLAAVLAVGLSGCGGDDNPNNNGGGGGNHDSRLVNAVGEAWLEESGCTPAVAGFILKSNGDFVNLNSRRIDDNEPYWEVVRGHATWRTNGNRFIVKDIDYGEERSVLYEISNNSLIFTGEYEGRLTLKKCGVNVGW